MASSSSCCHSGFIAALSLLLVVVGATMSGVVRLLVPAVIVFGDSTVDTGNNN
jgi:hypothetical protein